MIKNRIKLLMVLWAFALPSFLGAQTISEKMEQLEEDFTRFRYEQVLKKGRFLLGDPFAGKKDSLEIYTYMLNSAYALGDTTEAKSIIISILKTDVTYSLDPAETSPKIIDFYNLVRDQNNLYPKPTLPSQNDRPEIIKIPAWHYLANVVAPGSGFYLNGNSRKGLYYSAVSLALGSAIIYSSVLAQQRRENYNEAGLGDDFNRLYSDYDNAYKWRNGLVGAFIVYSLYSLYDFHESTNPSLLPNMEVNKNAIEAGIVLRW